jgi:hypothetical protein
LNVAAPKVAPASGSAPIDPANALTEAIAPVEVNAAELVPASGSNETTPELPPSTKPNDAEAPTPINDWCRTQGRRSRWRIRAQLLKCGRDVTGLEKPEHGLWRTVEHAAIVFADAPICYLINQIRSVSPSIQGVR